jgi:phage I-like protein
MDEKRVAVGRLKAVVGPPEQSPRRAAKVGGEPPEWMQIFPDGEYTYDHGGKPETALCDAESRAAVIATFAARGNDLVIDYEHQTLDGGKAPAAGWIKELEDRGSEGLWARVEWTAEAAGYLRTGEYRYDSPVFDVDKETRRVVTLHHVALTNWPASHDRAALTEQIAAKARARYETRSTREGVMDWNKDKARSFIRWGADIPATATNNDVRKLIETYLAAIPADDNLFVFDSADGDTVAASLGVTFGDAAPAPATEAEPAEVVAAKAVLEELELEEGATLAQVQARIVDLRTPAGMIATSVHQAVVAERDELKNQLAQLEATTEEEKLNQLIAANRRKVTPAKEPFVRRMAKSHGLAHAAEVVKNMADALPTEDLAAAAPPPAEPPVDTTQISATRRVRDKELPVDQESALRKLKVEGIQKEKPELNLSYAQANEELKRREAASS